MLRKKTCLIAISLLSVPLSFFAEENALSSVENNHRLYIGPSASWYNIEYVTDQDQSGPMYGGIIGYDYLKNDMIYAGAQFNYLAGKLVGSFGNDFTQELWTEGRLGYRFSLGSEKKASFTPFTGYGYFVFLQDLDPGVFRYRFMYVPIGFRATCEAADFLEIGINAMGGIPFSSKWSVDETLTGNTRIIAYVEVPFRFYLTPQTKRFDLSIVPYWRNWSIRSQGNLIGQINNIVGAEIQFGVNL